MSKALDKARDAHPDLPDWIEALAVACDRDGQASTARRLGISASAVSNLVAGRYGADTSRMERLVRTALVASVVTCPAMGSLAQAQCIEWQDRAGKPAVNGLQRRMKAACAICPQVPRKEKRA